MNLDELVAYVADSGIIISHNDGKLGIKEPRPNSGLLTADFKASIREHKQSYILRIWPPIPETPQIPLEPIRDPEPIPDPIPIPSLSREEIEPFPYHPFYWRGAMLYWPIKLRQKWADFAEYWAKHDEGTKHDSPVWNEWKAWKGVIKLIRDHERDHPDKPFDFTYPDENRDSESFEIPDWTDAMAFPEMLMSAIRYSQGIASSPTKIPNGIIEPTKEESKPKPKPKPKPKNQSRRNKA